MKKSITIILILSIIFLLKSNESIAGQLYKKFNEKGISRNQRTRSYTGRHNAKIRKENESQRKEYEREKREVDQNNQRVKKHNQQIQRAKYNRERKKAQEKYHQRKNPGETKDFGRKPYLSDDYHDMMRN